MTSPHPALADLGITVFERDWLSSNNVLIQGDGPTALIDSGYSSHAPLTLALVRDALQARPLDLLLNTHLHSDHCGGNAMLQAHYPGLQTLIPPGLADAVEHWDPVALTFAPTGQVCHRFVFNGLLRPGNSMRLGSHTWDIHGAKGHDPHSIILFQPEAGVLISADALWNNGFGVVFPELEGIAAFDEVRETLDLIETLQPRTVIPGHGPVFHDVSEALARARSRLAQFTTSPDKHHRYAIKVLLKFRLLEWQSIARPALLAWAQATPYLRNSMPGTGHDADQAWLDRLIEELVRSGSARLEGDEVFNA